MTLEAIINKTIAEIKKSGAQLSPSEYKRCFCKELKRVGLSHPDCEKVSKLTERLNENYKKVIKNYVIKDEDELVWFMISQLNRLKPAENEALINYQTALLVKVLKSVLLLKNKEASQLAMTTLDKISNLRNVENLQVITRNWEDFLVNYSDSFVDAISKYCMPRKTSLDLMFDDIKKCFDKLDINSVELTTIVAQALQPSISINFRNELEQFSLSLLADPSRLKLKKTQQEIKELISKRIAIDNSEVKNRLKEIDRLVDLFSTKLVNVSRNTQASLNKIQNIRLFINQLGEHSDTFENVKSKLIKMVDALDIDLNTVKSSSDSISELQLLKSKVSLLEKQLETAKSEANIDRLTKLANRRGLEEYLIQIEEQFFKYANNYVIVFFEIDKFKDINDNYGLMASDTVLASFGLILKKHSKDGDFVGRWDGENFMAILNSADLIEGCRFAQSVCELVARTKFIYKDSRMAITISAGVACRNEENSLKSLMKLSDKRLGLAKNTGRNRVEPDVL